MSLTDRSWDWLTTGGRALVRCCWWTFIAYTGRCGAILWCYDWSTGREAPPEADLCWRELAIVAKALADGRDMTEIGLMRDIALRTIAVLGDAGRMW